MPDPCIFEHTSEHKLKWSREHTSFTGPANTKENRANIFIYFILTCGVLVLWR